MHGSIINVNLYSYVQKLVDELMKEHMPKKEVRKRSESRGYSWFSSWRRTNPEEENQDAAASSNTNKSEPEVG